MRRLAFIVSLAVALGASDARALFHFAHIAEVNAQGGGDSNVQYVEIVMDQTLQRFVMNSILTAFDCDGTPLGDLLLVPADVPNQGAGVRWIMATATPLGGITPDFSGVTASIPTSCGQVCWGAPPVSFAVPPPDSWDHTDPELYVDCVAYGPYTGPTKTTSGTPTSLPPGDGTLALVRMSSTGDNATDFALACPSPENNAGAVGDFGACAATTTTTTPGGTTTTTTLPGSDDLLPGKKLDVRTKPGKSEKTKLAIASTKDAALTLGAGAGSADDPTQAGGELTLVPSSAAGAFVSYPLASAGWSAKTKKGTVVGYKYKNKSGPITAVKIKAGKTLSVKGKGDGLELELETDPQPVGVILAIGAHRYCLEFGGGTFTSSKRLKVKNTSAPSACVEVPD